MVKKIVSLFLALIMVTQYFPMEVIAEVGDKWPTPTDLQWGYKVDYVLNEDGDAVRSLVPGVPSDISFKAPIEEGALARLRLVKKEPYDRQEIINTYAFIYDGIGSYDTLTDDLESGDYYFTVKITGRGYEDSDTAISDIWHYTRPDVKLGQCIDLVWDNTCISFTSPEDQEHIGWYQIRWLFGQTPDSMEPDNYLYKLNRSDASECDLRDSSIFSEDQAGYYGYQIRLISDDITKVCHGEWSACSDALYYDGQNFSASEISSLEAVTNLRWDGAKLCFDDPNVGKHSGQYTYQYVLYFGNNADAEPYEWAWFEQDTPVDMSALIWQLKDPEFGYYYFTVQPYSKDMTKLSHGNVSEMSPGFHFYGQDLGEQSGHTHSFGDWVVILEPTASTTGIRQRSCTCGAIETEDIPVRSYTLAELSAEDYLAFSHIAYKNFEKGKTVESCLRSVWNIPIAEAQPDITYQELCEHIANWTVQDFISKDNGFAAVSFINEAGEVVVAYRGSKPISNFLEIFTSDDPDVINDWQNNDLAMILNNHIRDENQFADALEFYRDVVRETGSSNIVTTGHSLGGLWGDVVSAYSGCKGVTFNAISALDVIYSEFYQDMAPGFTGIDRWNFMDHANKNDILAGKTEYIAAILVGGTKLKPFISYESDYGWWSFGSNHGLHSYLNEVNGKPTLNARSGEWRPTTGVSNYLSSTLTSVDMGVSRADYFDKGLTLAVSRTSYGGDGYDTIISSIRGDTLIGGNNSDILDGGWGSDTYVYYKGNGCDTICDTDGSDKLYLKGFGANDRIEVFEERDSDFIDVLCNGETIVRISKKNREYSLAALDTFKIYVEKGSGAVQEYDITEAFERFSYGSHLLICCPVDVQILDAHGNVVHTVKDGEISRVHNAYGNFYVFQEDDGGYGKALDLAEGYTAQIVGLDDGTMDITYYDVKNGELAEPQVMEDIPVSQGYTALVEETGNGGFRLVPEDGAEVFWGDVNGDGWVDSFDASLIMKYDVMLIGDGDLNLAAADVSGDGFVDSYDASLILKFDVMLIEKFPVEG